MRGGGLPFCPFLLDIGAVVELINIDLDCQLIQKEVNGIDKKGRVRPGLNL